jgi:hypothetical protein
VAEAPGTAFAATWRDERGAIVGTTYGGTMCLWPVKPWRIRFHRDGFEGVMRCRECPGCLEFDRRRMADRLLEKYGTGTARGAGKKTRAIVNSAPSAPADGQALFVVRIWAPMDQHAAIANKLHRRRGLELEPGMWRLGASSFALLSREARTLRAMLRLDGVKFRIEPLRLSRGRRAWRVLTAGLTVAREIYGEQRNRWYARGLPPAERQRWEVKKVGRYQSYDRVRSPRAWSGSALVLVPPEVWKLCRTDRRSLRGQLLRASDPEGVARVMRLVADALRHGNGNSGLTAAPKALLTREAVVAQYQRFAAKSSERAALQISDPDLPLSSEREGYVSSGSFQGELMPLELARARKKAWDEARKRKAIKDSMEIIERMRRKAPRGGNDRA